MSANWGKKLANKLNALNESSSRESIQTLAKWIGFNRKHMAVGFVPVLQTTLSQAKSGALQLTYLSVLHEVLIMEKEENATKWEKMEEMRVALGEGVLLKIVGQLHDPSRDKLKTTFLKEWDDSNSFGGPTLINAIRKSVSSSNKASSESSSPSKTAAAEESSTPQQPHPTSEKTSAKESKDVTMEDAKQEAKGKESNSKDADKTAIESAKSQPCNSIKTKPAYSVKTPPTPIPTTTYDFEASGIAAADVDPKTLLEPTRTIASLQIARDLRNDGAVQLASLLSNLPDNIKQSCTDKEELTADKARDYAMRIPDVLIDMDLEEQLQSIRMYRDIVKRQGAARQKLIRALIQSRCQFGASEAADAFETAHRARGQLLKRKQVLMDAMELEGLDVTEEEKNFHAQDTTEFAPLEWHKKARTEEA